MAHDLNSLASLFPANDIAEQTLNERILYSKKLSEEIMVYLRELPLHVSCYSSRELFEGILAEFEPSSGIKYRIRFEDNLNYVHVDLELIEQAVIAILANALKACKIEGSELIITLSRKQNKSLFIEHDWLEVSVKDDGPGIPHEFISDISKPFFTTWKDDGHIGLGLPLADKIIQKHRGSLEIKSQLGKGTVTSFYLPMYNDKI
jgi:signal transduction histidine kinase